MDEHIIVAQRYVLAGLNALQGESLQGEPLQGESLQDEPCPMGKKALFPIGAGIPRRVSVIPPDSPNLYS